MKSHEGLEGLIKGLARRIKEIEESPGPTTGRAKKLHWELGKERLEEQLVDWQRGRPSLDGPGYLSSFFRSMGFALTMGTSTSQYITPTTFGEYKAICDRMGFPGDKLCDKVVSELAMRQIDALPKPDAIFSDSHACDNDHNYFSRSYGDLFNIPAFFIDVPLNEDDKPNLADLNYVANQLGEFIEWAEKKVPGVKYDEDRHIEMLEADAIGSNYLREIYQLLKHVPCPSSPTGIQRRFASLQPSRYRNMQKAIEYVRACRDELREQVASSTGPYPEERLRLLWAGKGNYLEALDLSKLLMERKVALPLYQEGLTTARIGLRGAPYGDVSRYGVKLSPLQEEAAVMTEFSWGGPGKRWVTETLKAARDIGAHGIIHFQLIGCTPMRGMGSMVAERAEKELGIPTLNIEGRFMDPDYMSQEQFDETLSPFIDKCFDWAGKPRQ